MMKTPGKLSTTGTSRPNANTFEGMAEETTVNIIESVYDFFLETGQNVWDPEKQMEIVAICAPRLFAWLILNSKWRGKLTWTMAGA